MCQYGSAFSSAFAICVPSGGTGSRVLLPPGYGKKRKKRIVDAAGVGVVLVVGYGRAEAVPSREAIARARAAAIEADDEEVITAAAIAFVRLIR